MKRNTGIFVAALFTFLCATALADEFPTKTIRVINQFGAGGGADLTARPILDRLEKQASISLEELARGPPARPACPSRPYKTTCLASSTSFRSR